MHAYQLAALAVLALALAGCGTAAVTVPHINGATIPAAATPAAATQPAASPSASDLTDAEVTAICSQLGGQIVTNEGGVIGGAEGGADQVSDIGGWASCMFRVADGDVTPANVPASIAMGSDSGEPIGTVWCPHYSGNTQWTTPAACLALADS
jgi:hypothetical protein